MRITLFQFDIVWTDKTANFKKVTDCLNRVVGKTDLIVLPEMFSTGFCVDRPELAETMQGETISLLKQWAKTYQIAIVGSFLCKENSQFFNRGFFVYPNTKFCYADKKHLFSYGGEDKLISSGNSRLIIHYKGINIFLLICYDIRFPVWARNIDNAYDLLIYTASFPHSRMKVWDRLLPARAIENMSYVCGVNRVGKDTNGTNYSGHSVLLDYQGDELVKIEENKEDFQTYNLEKEPLETFRGKYRFWKDADKFSI